MFSKNYMPYVIQPEQELIRMPENELYAELVRLWEQASTGLTSSHVPAPTLELDNSPERCYFSRKWCPIRKIEVAKTFEECDEVNECLTPGEPTNQRSEGKAIGRLSNWCR
ncbi:uncharacterized protein B0J16DRAFT_349627 [Fusarium flagelliforme]|uniref:uncharacterized protein n=1 Tax=Fusarium flagelliforme TaxID=2675880 RepID=UPI001E8E7C1B|nr:uncharacterized protein B0J16DRAFT_349627 [Fusarium flagelliforme]KAH7175163.1 hypothetical protein B0J16DRAFT_349627 [Fusarium flagelliforme]